MPVDRHTLQAQRRAEEKRRRKQKGRWLRRFLYAAIVIVLLAILGAGGAYYYTNYRFSQIKKVHAPHLVTQTKAPGKPFNVLLVGSDSRAFVGDNAGAEKAFGSPTVESGQRSDVIIVARFVPATKSITLLSIPRDLWVNIPGDVDGISGMNRINAAFNSGPDLLIQTIETDLHIPINHYVAVNFPGFQSMVDALGGVTMNFPTQVRDSYTGLDITSTGCQAINGTQALSLVRSRHLEYKNANGYWEGDGLSDFSRIQRQDAFFRAMLQKLNAESLNPISINGFIGAAVKNLTIDDTLTKDDLYNIATTFHGIPNQSLQTETLPTTSEVTDGGADVLLAAQPYANQMIFDFNLIGASTTPTTTTTTTAPKVPISSVSVQVLNGAGIAGIAGQTAADLKSVGFQISGTGNASSSTFTTSQIEYDPVSGGRDAAEALAAHLTGGVTLVADPTLTPSGANDVTLIVANSSLQVTGVPGGTSTSTTGPTTSTTIPGNVYTNTQPEPWNPVPCTL